MNIRAILPILVILFSSGAALAAPVEAMESKDTAPEKALRIKPSVSSAPLDYPVAEMRLGIKGTTTLRLTINVCTGQLLNIALDKSSGNKNLDRAAANAALKSTYSPTADCKDPDSSNFDFLMHFVFG